MKSLRILVACGMLLGSTMAFADQSTSEKATDQARDVGRDATAKKHHVEEKMCAKGDAKCAKDKAEHKTGEASEATKDKAKEIKDKADSDSKPTK